LKLDERDAALLEEGSVLPDRMQEFPHHAGKEMDILNCLFRARDLFLKEDDECFYYLGIALHYVQDGWTSKPKVRDKHTKWEYDIQATTENTQLIWSIKHVFEIGDFFSILQKEELVEELVKSADARASLALLFEGWKTFSYGRKVFTYLSINRKLFENAIKKQPLPSQTIESYLFLGKGMIGICTYNLLTYHREWELRKEIFGENMINNFPSIHIAGEDVFCDVFSYSLSCYAVRNPNWFGQKFIKVGYIRWSTPYIDLFFAMIYSILLSCYILLPKDISPENWKKNVMERFNELIS